MILTIKTDNPDAEIGLFDPVGNKIGYEIWHGHRELSVTILTNIEQLLLTNNLGFCDLTAVVFFQGPGSFTGLRIGASVANSLCYGLGIKGAGAQGDNWVIDGISSLENSEVSLMLPIYGAEPHITQQKK